MKKQMMTKLGWFASFMAIIMFGSYIDQIRLNLMGKPGAVILPIATIVNTIAWIVYALLKDKKDWPIVVCNVVGLILGSLTLVTAIR